MYKLNDFFNNKLDVDIDLLLDFKNTESENNINQILTILNSIDDKEATVLLIIDNIYSSEGLKSLLTNLFFDLILGDHIKALMIFELFEKVIIYVDEYIHTDKKDAIINNLNSNKINVNESFNHYLIKK